MTKFAVSFGSRLATHCFTVCSVTGVDPQGGVTNHLFDLESRLIFDCTQRLFRWQLFMRFCSERPVADMHRDNFIFRHRPAHDYVKIMRLYFTSGYKAGASGSLPRTCLCVRTCLRSPCPLLCVLRRLVFDLSSAVCLWPASFEDASFS